MSAYDETVNHLKNDTKVWLITGVAGFIGSNLLEVLLGLNQKVVGLDNFSTGHLRNLDQVKTAVSSTQWSNFHFIKGDIRNIEDCRNAMKFPLEAMEQSFLPVEIVLHEAALGSVPRSIEDPVTTNSTNIDGFLNILVASRDALVKRFIYAASSSTYGDHPGLPKVEDKTGAPLSPYAVTKLVNELYANVFSKVYGMQCIGLRYFNVFGPRQDPNGAYAAVIPKWIAALINNSPIFINGDGETSRDFCFVENVIQANLLAALTHETDAINQVYNVAVGDRTTLNQLFNMLKEILLPKHPELSETKPHYQDFRAGDVRHSLADISKAKKLLGYDPTHRIYDGLCISMDWYQTHCE